MDAGGKHFFFGERRKESNTVVRIKWKEYRRKRRNGKESERGNKDEGM